MTGLLVSVRNAGEARIALTGGADLIDVKEPNRGSLGAADPADWSAVKAEVDGRVPLSLALGELAADDVVSAAGEAAGFQYAKIGLAGVARDKDWMLRWKHAIGALPESVTAVAVAYADWRAAEAPQPSEVISVGNDIGCGALLMDTFRKSCGGLFDMVDENAMRATIDKARAGGMKIVLAGSLSAKTIAAALRYTPDYVAVRGAACHGDRTGRVDAGRVRGLAYIIAEGAPA